MNQIFQFRMKLIREFFGLLYHESLVVLMTLSIALTMVAKTWFAYENTTLINEIDKEFAYVTDLDVQFNLLSLENETLSEYTRIEHIAKEILKMDPIDIRQEKNIVLERYLVAN